MLNFPRSLTAADLPLMKIVLALLGQSFLWQFGLPAAMSITDPAIEKKVYGSGTSAFII